MPEVEAGWNRRGAEVETRPSDQPAREITQRLLDDRYRLEALIGTGGAGQVYRARDLELDEAVAVKILSCAGADKVQLLRQEVRLARRVTHPNVVRVHDLGVGPGDLVYLTMQFVPGISLGDLQRREQLGARAAAELGRQIYAGLDAAHRAGVLHLDLKPSNVLVWEEGGARRALISDFGVARAFSEAHAGPRAGTPIYMAPEQRRGGPLDARTDLFAAALVLYELFAGEMLFDTLPAAERVEISHALVRSRVPAPIADLLIQSLDPDPARRPASAAALASALGAFGESTHRVERGRPPRLAVVPFEDLSAAGDDNLGVAVAEELIRILSGISAVRVFAGGASAGDQEPRAIGTRLGADAVVRGTMQRAGPRVRMNVALVDVKSGLQLWGEHFDGAIQDVIAFQESMALRICESMRVRWISLVRTSEAPAEAVELYLRARRQLHGNLVTGPDGAVTLLDRCLELAPELGPAIALRALACCRAWNIPSVVGERDWAEECRNAVTAALAQAPALAESHLAAGVVAAQHGAMVDCVRALRRALELAPTAADAHEYLGRLLAEAGRIELAQEHLELAHTLNPTLRCSLHSMVRSRALRGDRSGCDELEATMGPSDLPARQLLMRIATWYGDEASLRRHAATLPRDLLPRETGFLLLYAHYVLGGIDPAGIDQMFASQLERLAFSGRVLSNLHQVMAEAHAARGELDRALGHLGSAAGSALIDLDWLENCPLLDRLRPMGGFIAALDRARRRAEPLRRL